MKERLKIKVRFSILLISSIVFINLVSCALYLMKEKGSGLTFIADNSIVSIEFILVLISASLCALLIYQLYLFFTFLTLKVFAIDEKISSSSNYQPIIENSETNLEESVDEFRSTLERFDNLVNTGKIK